MQTILVTGGAGFIGANFIEYFLNTTKDIHIVNLDALTYAGTLSNLTDVKHYSNYTFERGDICDRRLIEKLFEKYRFKGVIHFAAESHVDNSINNPDGFVNTNINGTFNLIDVAKNFWMKGPNDYKQDFKNARFHQISTDEVYGDLQDGVFDEASPLKPSNPYSATKAAADMLVQSYARTYGIEYIIARPSNNYGSYQYPEKLIPLAIKQLSRGRKIKLHNQGKPIRTWTHSEDTASALITLYEKAERNKVYNISSQYEQSNYETVKKIINSYFYCGWLFRIVKNDPIFIILKRFVELRGASGSFALFFHRTLVAFYVNLQAVFFSD